MGSFLLRASFRLFWSIMISWSREFISFFRFIVRTLMLLLFVLVYPLAI